MLFQRSDQRGRKSFGCQCFADHIPNARTDAGHRNWGLTEHELQTIPPALARGFKKHNASGGFGSDLPGDFGRLLMRGAYNSDLYGPLQAEFEKGQKDGTDAWIHKNR